MKLSDLDLSIADEALDAADAAGAADGVVRGEERDVAIVGISAAVASAPDKDAFWKLIEAGESSIGTVNGGRREDLEGYLGRREDSGELWRYSPLPEIDKFDHRFFALSPLEASLMDPHQRLFLQSAWHALEDAGYAGDAVSGTRTGVFAGLNNPLGQYRQMVEELRPEDLPIAHAGNLAPIVASRVSYHLNLSGPSYVVNTACSSSLVAVNLACRSLRSGECEMALAGGVKLELFPVDSDSAPRPDIGILAPDGKTRTFDEASRGTNAGEGVLVVVLKPLRRALEDRDSVYAVIKGGAINHDGRSNGITAPNPASQTDALCRAWEDAGIDPQSLSYVEAHGTGTTLGDPIEATALTEALRRYRDDYAGCAVGSLKANVGHLDSAAGIGGLVKVALSLSRRKLPPAVHFEEPNRAIDFVDSPLYVNNVARDWDGEHPRRAGVSSFGLSGTNCHLVLEEAPDRRPRSTTPDAGRPGGAPLPVLYSAADPGSLRALLGRHAAFLGEKTGVDLVDYAYTLARGRAHLAHRLAIVAATPGELRARLVRLFDEGEEAFSGGTTRELAPGVFYGRGEPRPGEAANEEPDGDAPTPEGLASAYVGGASPLAYFERHHGEGSRIHLPGYPFAEVRCWIEARQPKAPTKGRLSRAHREALAALAAGEIEGAEELAAELLAAFAGNPPVAPDGVLDGAADAAAGTEVVLKGKRGYENGEAEQAVAEAWHRVLGVREFDPGDNFFSLGGDSVAATTVLTLLKERFDVYMNDLFEQQTLAGLAGLLASRAGGEPKGVEVYKERWERFFRAPAAEPPAPPRRYLVRASGRAAADLSATKPYRRVLLTGITGFLGAYLCRGLLQRDPDVEVLAVARGRDDLDAAARVERALNRSFGEGFFEAHSDRVRTIAGDIAHPGFGGRPGDASLRDVDCVLHSAGLVKHYGHLGEFERVNVGGTRAMLELAAGAGADFKFVSSTAVADGEVEGRRAVSFTELDGDLGQRIDNYYGATKLRAEELVRAAREEGALKASVFRVGHILGDSESGRFQENMDENGIYRMLRFYHRLGAAPVDDGIRVPFSPVDRVADAVLLLADRERLLNDTFHVSSDHTVSFAELLALAGAPIGEVDLDAFFGLCERLQADPHGAKLFDEYLLHAGLASEKPATTEFHLLKDLTRATLGRLGFEWLEPEPKHASRLVEHCRERGFLTERKS